MELVYAKSTALVGLEGRPFQIEKGEAYTKDHPVVKAHPSHFADLPPTVYTADGVIDTGVEQATAAPGEKRRKK